MDPQIRQIYDQVKRLGDLPEDVAPDVARAVRADLKRTIEAGTTPDGEPWPPRKEDGEQALQGAMDSLFVGDYGASIYVRLKGPETRHHRGHVKGGVQRQVIPDKHTVPDKMADAISKVLDAHFAKVVSDGG